MSAGGWWESLLLACGGILAVELLGCLWDGELFRFLRRLAVLLLLVSGISGLFSALPALEPDLRLSRQRSQALQEYVEQESLSAARRAAEDYLWGLLAAGGTDVQDLQAEITLDEEGSIGLDSVRLRCAFPSQGERAKLLLRNILGDAVEIEVDDGS